MCGSNFYESDVILNSYPKSLENSKSALVCAIIAQRVKIALQPLHTSIRANWEFSSNCDCLYICSVERQKCHTIPYCSQFFGSSCSLSLQERAGRISKYGVILITIQGELPCIMLLEEQKKRTTI